MQNRLWIWNDTGPIDPSWPAVGDDSGAEFEFLQSFSAVLLRAVLREEFVGSQSDKLLANDAALRARQEIEHDLEFRAFLDLEREPASRLVEREA